MAQPKVAIRLGTEGKSDVVRDFREVGDAGDAAAKRAARGFDQAASDFEAAERRMASASQKIAAIMPKTAIQMQIEASSGSTATGGRVERNAAMASPSAHQEGSARVSAANFRELLAEQERYEASAQKLRAVLNPVWAAQQRFNAEMKEARALVANGSISLDEYCAKLRMEQDALKSTGTAHEAGIDRTSRLRYAYQSLGYQIQDIGASLSTVSGPSGLFRIFAQQGGQVFDALNQIAQAGGNASKGTQEVGEASDDAGADLGDLGDKAIGVAEKVENTGGKFGKFAAFMSGPWGAAIMVGLSVLGPLVAKLFESGEASEEAAKAAKEHAAAIDSLIDAMERETRTADQLTRQKYADAWAERQSTIETERKTQALIAQAKARMAIADAQKSDGTGEGGVNFGVTAGATQEAMIAALEKQAQDAQDRIDAITLAMKRQQSQMTVSAVEATRDPQKRVQRDYDRAYAAALANQEKTGDIEAFARAIKAAQDARDAELKKIQESEKALRSSAAARKDGDSATPKQVSNMLLEAFGGTITSTTGGKHVKNSYHYRGQAVDFVPTGGMGAIDKDAIRAVLEGAGLTIKELLGPGDKGHNDHFHVAWSGGRGAVDSSAFAQKQAAEEERKATEQRRALNQWVQSQNPGQFAIDGLNAEGERRADTARKVSEEQAELSAGTALLNMEWDKRNKNEATDLLEIERYRLDIVRQFPDLTADQVDQLVKAKEGQVEMNRMLEDYSRQYEEFRRIGESAIDRLFDPSSAESWGDRVKGVINDLINEFIRMAAINPLKNMLFGTDYATMGGGSGGGDIFSAVLSSFMGGSAIGNEYTPAGSMLVGENGPEIVEMPRGAKVMTASESRRAMSGGDAPSISMPISIDATGADAAGLSRVQAELAGIRREMPTTIERVVRELKVRSHGRWPGN